MTKIYHLKTCGTCQKILKALPKNATFELQEIKANPIKTNELDALAKRIGSYESLFNKRSKLYKEMGLKDANLTEKDYRHYILENYTMLNRPVIVTKTEVFAGNRPKTIQKALEHLQHES